MPSPTKSNAAQPRKAGSKSKALKEYRFSFGKYKGQPFSVAPASYVDFCIDKGIVNSCPAFKRALQAREASRAPSPAPSRNPALLSIEQRRARVRRAIPAWLFEACEDALHPHLKDIEGCMLGMYGTHYNHTDDAEDTQALEALVNTDLGWKFVNQYPPRPSKADVDEFVAKSGESEAVRMLIELVEDYPDATYMVGKRKKENDPRFMDRDCGFSGADWIDVEQRLQE
ncbi:hypothetical protein AAF712_005268 [Marasmius tenuissimus]|uniref:Uncharacterized protein n=1 Tax=Marasmius tenuissimus TaxID=585030 RepID=A0ABR3A1R6_9AGAR